VNLASLNSNTKYHGQHETKVKGLIDELAMLKEEGANAIIVWGE
jgi:ATP-dependent Clp protease ATP-binding subunit ClpA